MKQNLLKLLAIGIIIGSMINVEGKKRLTNKKKLSNSKLNGIFDEHAYSNVSEHDINNTVILNDAIMSYIEVDFKTGEQYLHEIIIDNSSQSDLETNDNDASSGNGSGDRRRATLYVDDRVQIDSTAVQDYELNNIGMLRFQDGNGNWHTCTGTLVGPRDVLTSGHCIHSGGTNGEWYNNFYFYLKRTGSATYDSVYHASGGYAVYGWFGLKNWIYDYGIVKLDISDTGKGWAHFSAYPDDQYYHDFMKTLEFRAAGYPSDKSYGTLWKTTCHMDEAYSQYMADYQDCNFRDGNDGTSMFASFFTIFSLYARSGNKMVITKCVEENGETICSGYPVTANYYVRINEGKLDLICDMIDYDVYSCR